MNWRIRLVFLSLTVIALGCAARGPTTRPTHSDRQAAALRDPFNYKPGMEEHNISGGDLGNLDRGAIKRDMNHVLNP